MHLTHSSWSSNSYSNITSVGENHDDVIYFHTQRAPTAIVVHYWIYKYQHYLLYTLAAGNRSWVCKCVCTVACDGLASHSFTFAFTFQSFGRRFLSKVCCNSGEQMKVKSLADGPSRGSWVVLRFKSCDTLQMHRDPDLDKALSEA